MKVLYLPDVGIGAGEVQSDNGRLPRRYISAIIFGLESHHHDVHTFAVDSHPAYRALQVLARRRYRRYIWLKLLLQALYARRHARHFDLILADKGTSNFIRMIGGLAGASKLVGIWYTPAARISGFGFGRSASTAMSAILCVSRKQISLLRASVGPTGCSVLYVPMGVDTEYFRARQATRKGPWIVVGDEHRDENMLRVMAGKVPGGVMRVSPVRLAPHEIIPGVHYESGVKAERLRMLYDQARGALVLTDNWSGLPGLTVILEAMAMGLPVIATETVATREYISDGTNGFVIPFGDAQSALLKMHLLERPGLAEAFGAASRRLAECFSIDAGSVALDAALRLIPQ